MPRCLREHTLTNLVTLSKNAQIHIEILGHFVLHSNELTANEIEMFDLTSDFGDIYEGHILRINHDKLTLLLSSTDHSYIKLSSAKHIEHLVDKPVGIFEDLVLDQVRKYLQNNSDESSEEIRRIEIEIEPKTNSDKRQIKIYLLSDDDLIDTLSFEISEHEDFQSKLEILQGIDEKSLIESIADQLRQSNSNDFSWNDEMIENMRTMFDMYAKDNLSNYGREQCLRLAIEYGFDDMLGEFDCEEIQQRLRRKMQRHLVRYDFIN